jgi:predicted enzyme related to lactoylglutathione lyase
MAGIIHFEINADNPERACEFYSKAFGWKIENLAGGPNCWLVATGAEAELGIRYRMGNWTTVNTIGVSSVDEAIRDIERAGGKMVQPKMHIPGIGYLAYCQDTEGNIFGIVENDPSAN